MKSVYDFEVETLAGNKTDLSAYRGKVVLIVNTASKCGLTPQLEGLEELHRELEGDGFSVLGFPCNQFANQDPGTNEEIGAFCVKNYGVSFPMHAKVKVNGPSAHPLFTHLKERKKGKLGVATISWNFTKFLVDAEGNVVQRFKPKTEPREIREAIVEQIARAKRARQTSEAA
jgi:glutathione peroxidase